MPDRRKTERRAGERRKSIPLMSAKSPFVINARLLVIHEDLGKDFSLCQAKVDALDGYGAWLSVADPEHKFPTDEELLLIEFEDVWVLTHHTRVLKREGSRILVDAPSVTERERSQLAPTTGRHDYRVKVNLPVRVKTESDSDESDGPPRLARLIDLSRGGMALLTPTSQSYTEGEKITVRVVSWDHPVQIDAEVSRVGEADEEGKQKLALQFPTEMTLMQRESVSTFIIQAQRRDALARALPSDTD